MIYKPVARRNQKETAMENPVGDELNHLFPFSTDSFLYDQLTELNGMYPVGYVLGT